MYNEFGYLSTKKVRWHPRNGNYNLFKSVKVVLKYASADFDFPAIVKEFRQTGNDSGIFMLRHSNDFHEDKLIDFKQMKVADSSLIIMP
jgi:hypothetical protein